MDIRIGEERVKAENRFGVIDPCTGEIFADAPETSETQLDAVVEAAALAQVKWATDEAARRAALHECAATLRVQAEPLAAVLCAEQGKPFAKAHREVMGAARWFEYTADLPLETRILMDTPDMRVELHRRPLGVVGAITPWNYPVMSAVWKIAPALLAGNSVILKPSPFTPLSALKLADMLENVLPAGVLHVVAGGGALGAALSAHPGVQKVSFTGSTATGKKVYAAGAADMKRLTLELGGNDAAIVLDDVDPEKVAEKIFWGAFENSGQVCVTIKRLYVHERIADALVKALVKRAEVAKLGAPMEEGVELGPVNNAPQFARVQELVEDARKVGGRIETGGARRGDKGYFWAPTIVTGLGDEARLVREEQFGPALPVLTFKDADEAITRANASAFGLAGSIWSADPARAAALSSHMQCGTVWINQHLTIMPIAPINGWKQSGLGVENGVEGLAAFSQFQTVEIALT